MKARSLQVLAMLVAGCALMSGEHPPDRAQDLSIEFPALYPPEATEVDGVILRALRVAADDFLSPDRGPRACVDTQEAHQYFFLRRGDIIFVRIQGNPEYCDAGPYLDGGGWYAISLDGRILSWAPFDPRPELHGPGIPVPLDDAGRPIFDPDPRDDAGNPILSSDFLRYVERLRAPDAGQGSDAGAD